MTVEPYEVRVVGALGGAGRDVFRDVIVSTQPAITVLSGSFDQAGLHALLDRIRALGLELVDLKQAPLPSQRGGGPLRSSESDEA
jgi:hypothetical protein